MLAGLPVPAYAIPELAGLVRDVDDDLADRLEQALANEVKLLALSLDERALMLSALEDPPQELAELAPFCSPTTSGDAAKGSSDLFASRLSRPMAESARFSSPAVKTEPASRSNEGDEDHRNRRSLLAARSRRGSH